MNLRLADAALAAYREQLDDADNARLAFFRAIWEVQERIAADYAPAAHVMPGADDLRAWAGEGSPVLHRAPLSIDAAALSDACGRIAACVIEKGGFAPEATAVLSTLDWAAAVETSPLEVAGSNPAAYVDAFAQKMLADGMDEAAAIVAASAVSLALRALVEPAAAALQRALEDAGADEGHPLECPVCGAPAAAARVGVTKKNDGRAKTLWCAQCGSTWAFERVRCARCGTRNQGHLHYFNVEGDDSHRIATCDECGGYMRTVFQDDALAPFSFDVEDVVMARLDSIAMNQLAAQAQADAAQR